MTSSRNPSPHVVMVNLALVPGLRPEELLDRLPGIGRFSSSLAEAGARVTVLARAEADAELRVGAVRLITVHGRDEPLAPLRHPSAELVGRLRQLSPDLVHLGGFLFPVPTAAVRTALPRRVPLLLQHHGEPPGNGRLGVLQRLLLRLADGILVTSRGIADEWVRSGHLPRRIAVHEVLEASTDLRPVPRVEARRMTGLDGDPAILWVGRLHPRKDPFTALRAFEEALARLPDARLHMVYAEAPLLAELKGFVSARPPLVRAVRFVGHVPHAALADWYSAADLFLTSSPAEGSNWALIEAMACGLPAVATDIPANRRVAGEPASFFPPGDAHEGAAAIVQSGLRREPARHALRDHFERRLSWSVVAREALQAYTRAIALRAES